MDPGQVFQDTVELSAFFRRFVFENFVGRLSNVISRMEHVVFGPIDLCLSRALLEADKPVINMTHQELASDLGTAREVLSRHLKRYEKYGWIKLSRGPIEISDSTALRKLSE